MPYYLLTGAGFSRNWGGWLSNEVFEYLLGCPELDQYSRNLLWNTKLRHGGFEDTLSALQGAAEAQPTEENMRRLRAMNDALAGMFTAMQKAFAQNPFESDSSSLEVRRFLSLFDAIFTLNQDILLEQRYIGPRWDEKWAGSGIPQIELIEPFPYPYPAKMPSRPALDKVFPDNEQPYFKLHGSSNWTDGAGGERLLIMGANKEGTIRRFPVLANYQREFKRRLSEPGARLMVIGYSFGDDHINTVIADAIDTGLKLFIVDPMGVDVLDKQDPRASIRIRDPYMERLTNGILGASRRPFRATIAEDRGELAKLWRFLEIEGL